MEKTEIKCTIDDIQKMKETIEKNNNDILECLKELDKNYEDMPNVLSTPNSSKMIPEFLDYVRKQEQFMIESGNYYKKVFNTIISEYNEFINETKEKVGGDK